VNTVSKPPGFVSNFNKTPEVSASAFAKATADKSPPQQTREVIESFKWSLRHKHITDTRRNTASGIYC